MDPAALRDTLLDYTIRTLWAAVVVVIALVLARALRTVTMRRLTRHRAQANATILLGNLAQLGVIVLGVLVVLAIYTQGAFGWILTSFSVVGIVIGLSLQDIQVESPVDGFILKRSVSPGLRFDRGFEFYRIADLNRVWILADVYRDQLPFIRRGASARITTAEASRALAATVSPSEPIFDEATLTLRVRLEAANPKLALKPGMFVDIEFPVKLPSTLVVPADAIVDTGLRKTVFVDRGNGYFEPRSVETGWRIGDDVEVRKGLVSGERIVISGTFLVDSESRMKAVAKP